MKKTIFLTTLLFFGAICAVSAQGIFKVIASSGSNTKGGAAVKIGTQLASADQIVVGAKSYLGLSYAKGGTVQISKAGTYSAKDLETKLLASSKSSAQKYADFIIGEVVKGSDGNIHKNPYAYQNVTGSVERSGDLLKSKNPEVTIFLPKENNCLNTIYTFHWAKLEGTTSYVVEIKNNFEEVVKKVTVTETSFSIDLNKPEFKEADLFIITVVSKENPGNAKQHSFKRPEEGEIKAVENFKKSLGADYETIAQKQLDLAVFLEDKSFVLDAEKHYKKAAELEPENQIMQIAYNQYKIRLTGLVDASLKAENKE